MTQWVYHAVYDANDVFGIAQDGELRGRVDPEDEDSTHQDIWFSTTLKKAEEYTYGRDRVLLRFRKPPKSWLLGGGVGYTTGPISARKLDVLVGNKWIAVCAFVPRCK